MPPTTPVAEPTVPIAVALLLQVPPDVVQPNVVVLPAHTVETPVMAAGMGLTVKVDVV
jgi:hypothetical protein